MDTRSKVISKLYRLKMTGELRRFIEAIPVRNIHESQMGNNIYMANGEIQVGHAYYPVGIRIWFHDDRIVAQVSAPEAAVSIFVDPFDAIKTAEVVRRTTSRAAS